MPDDQVKVLEKSLQAVSQQNIKTTEVLNDLEFQLTEDFKQGRSLPHLYETVQYVANIVPRLYLLITIGVVQIKSRELPCREVLHDLVEMCRGVQHPMRGLFLRNYLLSSIRPGLLPDVDLPLPLHGAAHDGDLPIGNNNARTEDGTDQSDSGTVLDSVNFILINFAEMNKLWVRMQHQGHTRDRERREQERRDLRVLVGANIHRISQLESVSIDLYSRHILPNILEQIIQCRDVIAQEYLMDVIIQAFPDEFHAASFLMPLRACEQLQPAVRLRPIISSLVERLLRFASSPDSGDSILLPSGQGGDATETVLHTREAFSANLLKSLSREIDRLVSRRAQLCEEAVPDCRVGLPPKDVPGLFVPLVQMAICLHPENSAALVNEVLLAAANALERLGPSRQVLFIQPGSALSHELLKLLHLPIYGPGTRPDASDFSMAVTTGQPGVANLGQLDRLSELLNLTGLHRLFGLLDPASRRRLASFLISRALDQAEAIVPPATAASTEPTVDRNDLYRICRVEDSEGLFNIMDALVGRRAAGEDEVDAEEAEEERCLLASMIHLLGSRPRSRQPEVNFELLVRTRKWLSSADVQPEIIRAVFPVIVFEAMRLLPVFYDGRDTIESWETKVEQIIQFCHSSVTTLIGANSPDTALKLFLNCAQAIDALPFGKQISLAYEFFSQAFTLFEQELSQSRSQLSALCLIVSTLLEMKCLDAENFQVLRTQCTRAASHLLLRPDQSRAMAVASHLFWVPREPLANPEVFRHAKGLLGCIEKAENLADMCMDLDTRSQLYIDLVNYCIKFKQLGCEEVTDERISKLMAVVEDLMVQLDSCPETVSVYLANTKKKLNQLIESED
ncbi:unnamed protein product [Schistocephalus solidus]|uniref:Vacuolar protein sorting-associated protein 35 n=1 Tax=Schistocephalus solidus TaxID=70667 RepID=A0A183T7N7_SCHSO|nr:unnamed protein product [Schistocephalus solidus]